MMNMTTVAMPCFMRPVLVNAPPLARRPTRPDLLMRTLSTTRRDGRPRRYTNRSGPNRCSGKLPGLILFPPTPRFGAAGVGIASQRPDLLLITAPSSNVRMICGALDQTSVAASCPLLGYARLLQVRANFDPKPAATTCLRRSLPSIWAASRVPRLRAPGARACTLRRAGRRWRCGVQKRPSPRRSRPVSTTACSAAPFCLATRAGAYAGPRIHAPHNAHFGCL